jgi:hypothetical protein
MLDCFAIIYTVSAINTSNNLYAQTQGGRPGNVTHVSICCRCPIVLGFTWGIPFVCGFLDASSNACLPSPRHDWISDRAGAICMGCCCASSLRVAHLFVFLLDVVVVVARILQYVDGRILCADRLFLVSVPMRGRGSECVWFEGAMCRFW